MVMESNSTRQAKRQALSVSRTDPIVNHGLLSQYIFARIDSVCTFRDGLSFFLKDIFLIEQSNLWNCSERKVSTFEYVRSGYVCKFTTIFVCVHQRFRGGGRERT